MEKPFPRWQNFVIGLLIGIIAGGTVVWLEMKDANRNFLSQILFELNTLKLEKKITEDEIEKEKKSSLKKSNSAVNKISGKTKSENIAPASQLPDSEKLQNNTDSLQILAELISYDTISSDTVSVLTDNAGAAGIENIVVKKDRLLFSKTSKITMKDEVIQQPSNDSAVSEISGIHKENEWNEYIVEFWESPINYKGYKMANKKIILFGIDEEYDKIHLFQIDKKIYLKHNNSIYQLETTYSFEPLKKISDKIVIAKME